MVFIRRTADVAAVEVDRLVATGVDGGSEVDQDGVVNVPKDVIETNIAMNDCVAMKPLQCVKNIRQYLRPVGVAIGCVKRRAPGKDSKLLIV